MSTIINFAKGTNSVAVVPPDFNITQRTVTITRNTGDNSFRVAVGCQSVLITPDNIDQWLYEVDLPTPKPVQKEFILAKNITKANSKSAEFREKSTTYFISKGGKLYPKTSHHLVKAEVASSPKYFKKQSYSGWATVMISGSSHSISTLDLDNVKHILSVIKKYYTDSNIKTK